MHYNIIAAIDLKNGIGLHGTIPWKCKSDLKRFSKLTKGNGDNAIIMGRKTWESLPNNKPLPGRINIILTHDENYNNNNIKKYIDDDSVHIFNTVEDVKHFCTIRDFYTCWVIGGEQIYRLFIDDSEVDHLFLTQISDTFNCDTFFPLFNGFKIYHIDKWSDEETNLEIRQLEEEHAELTLEHGGERFWCLTCHHPDNRDYLRSLKNNAIDFDQSYRLCGQCHFQRQKDWFFGAHGKRIGNWLGQRKLYLCTECHDPHSPSIKPIKPNPPPKVRKGLVFVPNGTHHKPKVWEKHLLEKTENKND
jgi:dihydrofolate reductase